MTKKRDKIAKALGASRIVPLPKSLPGPVEWLLSLFNLKLRIRRLK